jgi:hypothetical protein
MSRGLPIPKPDTQNIHHRDSVPCPVRYQTLNPKPHTLNFHYRVLSPKKGVPCGQCPVQDMFHSLKVMIQRPRVRYIQNNAVQSHHMCSSQRGRIPQAQTLREIERHQKDQSTRRAMWPMSHAKGQDTFIHSK